MVNNAIFQKFDTRENIFNEFGDEYLSMFVSLNPFNKKVFSDNYDIYNNLELAFPLLEPLSWKEILRGVGFQDINSLAAALTQYRSPNYRVLEDYLADKGIEEPIINEETIPAQTIISVLQAIIDQDAKTVVRSYSQDIHFEDERNEFTYNVSEENMFCIAKELLYSSLILIPELNVSVLRPMKDNCPYTLIMAQNNAIQDVFKLEGFHVAKETKFHWWE